MRTKFLWVRGANGDAALSSDVERVLGPEVSIVGKSLYSKLILSDGREAWRAGPDWVVGRPEDLARIWDAVGNGSAV